ncbi:MAG: LysR family transcriptional regulator [Rhodoplanes sp.]|uniref:LysR family transcriptional regulator n=1 Tax=Rhodoplanes sp. TaxID=1968906 RepID=UPI0018288BBF|nr:LysR family transcriptional regulator [Rhodoplanes sp.]NVO17757.1 LysR family transcriptional regulator [Rhodoplanes sp.]
MTVSQISLNALRAFEAAARHLSFTRAGLELRVSQAAVSHQVRGLEEILGVRLFRRLPRGLALTDEGLALVPVLADTFARIRATLDQFEDGHVREAVTVGVVGTFAAGWLLENLKGFGEAHPYVDLRLFTNNNRVDIAGEGLDFAIRFGDGSWHGTDSVLLCRGPLSPICAPAVASRLARPADLARETLLRSYRTDEWPHWFATAGVPCPALRGPVFDSSVTMVATAAEGLGVALVPVAMFARELRQERLVRPFAAEVDLGGYWLTSLKSKQPTAGMTAFRDWLTRRLAVDFSDGAAVPPSA